MSEYLDLKPIGMNALDPEGDGKPITLTPDELTRLKAILETSVDSPEQEEDLRFQACRLLGQRRTKVILGNWMDNIRTPVEIVP